MARLAVLADIHGNLPALEAVLSDLASFHVDQIVIAGDVINWGPFSAQVVERVTCEGWPVTRGNNELYLLDYKSPRALPEWNDREQFPMLPWLYDQLAERWQTVIAGWPETLSLCFPDAPPIRVFHGLPSDPWRGLFPTLPAEEIETQLAGIEETTIIVAHTHLALDRQVGRWHILNPGSVGVPLDGELSTSYMLLEGDARGWRAMRRRLRFDYEPLFTEFERQRFVDECGVVGRLVLEEFRTARLQLHPFIHWRQEHFPNEPWSMGLLERFTDADRWEYTPLPYRTTEPVWEGEVRKNGS